MASSSCTSSASPIAHRIQPSCPQQTIPATEWEEPQRFSPTLLRESGDLLTFNQISPPISPTSTPLSNQHDIVTYHVTFKNQSASRDKPYTYYWCLCETGIQVNRKKADVLRHITRALKKATRKKSSNQPHSSLSVQQTITSLSTLPPMLAPPTTTPASSITAIPSFASTTTSSTTNILPCRVQHHDQAKQMTQALTNNPQISEQVQERDHHTIQSGLVYDRFLHHKQQIVDMVQHILASTPESSTELVIQTDSNTTQCSSLMAFIPKYRETTNMFGTTMMNMVTQHLKQEEKSDPDTITSSTSTQHNRHISTKDLQEKFSQILQLDQLSCVSHTKIPDHVTNPISSASASTPNTPKPKQHVQKMDTHMEHDHDVDDDDDDAKEKSPNNNNNKRQKKQNTTTTAKSITQQHTILDHNNNNNKDWKVESRTVNDTSEIVRLFQKLIPTSSTTKRKRTSSSSNLFCGFMGHDVFIANNQLGESVKGTVVGEMVRIGQEIKEFLIMQQGIPDDAIDWDYVFQDPSQHAISGFGSYGTQLYIKSGFTITLLHDELLWSSAVNLMTAHSRGCSLWISFQWLDAANHFTLNQLKEMTTQHRVCQLLHDLVQAKVPLYYFYQGPGVLVESPYGTGSVHIVISSGDYIEQLAFNRNFSTIGGLKCLWFWSQQLREEFSERRNMLSRVVVESTPPSHT